MKSHPIPLSLGGLGRRCTSHKPAGFLGKLGRLPLDDQSTATQWLMRHLCGRSLDVDRTPTILAAATQRAKQLTGVLRARATDMGSSGRWRPPPRTERLRTTNLARASMGGNTKLRPESNENSGKDSLMRQSDRAGENVVALSQSGPYAGTALSSAPSSFLSRIDSSLFRVLLSRRLRLPLPLCSRLCRCGRPLDSFGPGQRVPGQGFWATGTSLSTNPRDGRRLEIVGGWFATVWRRPTCGGHHFWCVPTIVMVRRGQELPTKGWSRSDMCKTCEGTHVS